MTKFTTGLTPKMQQRDARKITEPSLSIWLASLVDSSARLARIKQHSNAVSALYGKLLRMFNQVKDRKIAAALALAGVLLPGLHKFYLGQPRWGLVYLLLSWTPISKIASVLEGLWYLFHDREEFERQFGTSMVEPVQVDPAQVGQVAEALRQLEQLRQDGLISEYEFEQKRRHLVNQIG